MKRKQIFLLAGLAVAAFFVALLAFRNPQPPLMPRDAEHARVSAASDCLDCHAPGRAVPQSAKHPFGTDCTRCHGVR